MSSAFIHYSTKFDNSIFFFCKNSHFELQRWPPSLKKDKRSPSSLMRGASSRSCSRGKNRNLLAQTAQLGYIVAPGGSPRKPAVILPCYISLGSKCQGRPPPGTMMEPLAGQVLRRERAHWLPELTRHGERVTSQPESTDVCVCV